MGWGGVTGKPWPKKEGKMSKKKEEALLELDRLDAAQGALIQAEEHLLRIALGSNEVQILDAAKAYAAANTNWLRAKGAIG